MVAARNQRWSHKPSSACTQTLPARSLYLQVPQAFPHLSAMRRSLEISLNLLKIKTLRSLPWDSSVITVCRTKKRTQSELIPGRKPSSRWGAFTSALCWDNKTSSLAIQLVPVLSPVHLRIHVGAKRICQKNIYEMTISLSCTLSVCNSSKMNHWSLPNEHLLLNVTYAQTKQFRNINNKPFPSLSVFTTY